MVDIKRDINEHTQVENAFNIEKAFNEIIFNSLHDILYVFDLNGRFLRWNKSFSAITGYTDKEISTKKPTDFFLGRDVQRFLNAREMVVNNGTASIEAEMVTKNGERINYEFNGMLLKDDNGKPLGICEIGRNITEYKRMDLEYKTVLRSAMDGFYVVDSKGRILDVNDSYCSLIGYSRQELLSMSIKDIDAIDSEEMIAERIHRILKVGPERFETQHKCKDGRVVEIEASVNYSEAGGGKFFVFMRDITERKLTEELTKVRIRLFEFAAGHSLEELLRQAVAEIGRLVDSPIGFYHFVEPDQNTLTLQAWSPLTLERFCKAEGRGLHYSIDEAGVWADCIRQRKPVIHNNYASLPHRKGMPEGHAEVKRELAIPIFRDERIMAILGVGNKPYDYTKIDLNIVTYLADVVWEIVEHKKMEIVLKKSEARLSEAQRIAHIGNWEWNIKTNELYWSEENYRMFGLSRDVRPSFEAFLTTVHPDDRKFVQESINEALHGKTYDIDMRIIRPDGQERIVNAKAEVCFDRENKPAKMSGTVQDITERKHGEEKLDLFRYLIDKSNDAITIVNSETGIILDANEKASSSLGYSRDELLTMHVYDFETTLPDTFSWENHVKEIKKKGSMIVEGLHRRKDGTTFPTEVNVKFIDFEKKYRLVAIARNITERKLSEEKIRKALDEKELLLREIHHRVKKNMQIVSSLLRLQSQR